MSSRDKYTVELKPSVLIRILNKLTLTTQN
ncbi:hypothetical protein D8878_07925 [Streptococcus sanguinis]|uniref:Transposase n=1 Tax=Streptococcus sanguinis TaxID=1305 RepID=A0AB74DJ35_STRSA|nr:hypothetical protein D8879_08525 [Streptococcus sanguinis]RSI34752.1 hypothetical protein D8878_07925 [Streptococcus sanguinis]